MNILIKKNNLQSIPCSTLYGSLCLLSKLNDLNSLNQNYVIAVDWLMSSFFWLLNKIHSIQTNQLGTIESIEENLKCLNHVLIKIECIFEKNPKLINDIIFKITSNLMACN